VESPLVRATDICSGAAPHRLEALENLDILGRIAAASLGGRLVEKVGHGTRYSENRM
jgi:hypothetical protein